MATRAGTETILTAPRRNRHAAHEVMRHGRSHVGRVIRGAMATRTARDPTTTAWSGQVSGLGRVANQALDMDRAGPYLSLRTGPIRRKGARGLLARVVVGGDDLDLFLAHLVHETSERGSLDDPVELAPVGRDEAHALEQHVVDLPPLPGPVESVLDRNLLLPHGHDLGPHGRVVAVDRLADEEDLLARPVLDLRQVRPLEQIGEEPDELLALLRRALAPVPGQRTPRHLAEVEEILGDPAQLAAALVGVDGAGEVRVLDDRDRAVDRRLHDF